MNLTDYLRIIARRGWIILLAMILTTGSAYLFSKVQRPVYRATQKVSVQPARPDLGLTTTMKTLLGNYATWLDTDLRGQEVINTDQKDASGHIEHPLDMTPGQLHSMVTITPDLNNLLLVIDVDMADGEVAKRVAMTYGNVFIQRRNQQNDALRIEDRIYAELLDAPNYSLFRPNTAVNVAAGALLGLLIGGVIVFVLEYIDANIVRRVDDIERYLQLPVLGNLPNLDERG